MLQLTFIVVEMQLDFVLGMSFLKQHRATVDFDSKVLKFHMKEGKAHEIVASASPM